MELSTWLIYSAVALLSIISPGPAILLAVSNSIAMGVRRVAFSSLGNIMGIFVVSGTSMVGLGTVLKTSAWVFTVLKVLGAGYLIYLGIKQWRSKANIFSNTSDVSTGVLRTNRQLFTQGFFLATTNPKAILFFTALFPQFIRTQNPLLPQFFILTCTFMFFSFMALMSYAYLAHTAKGWFSNQRRAYLFNRVSGGIFMVLGVCMLRLKKA